MDLDVRIFRGMAHPSERFWQSLHEIGRHQRMFTHTFAGHIAGKTMKIDRGDHRDKDSVRILCDETRNHARQDVTRASGGHPRIPGRIHPNLATRRRHHGAMSF